MATEYRHMRICNNHHKVQVRIIEVSEACMLRIQVFWVVMLSSG